MLINQGLFSEQFSSGSSFKVGRFFSPVTEPVFNGVADLGCDGNVQVKRAGLRFSSACENEERPQLDEVRFVRPVRLLRQDCVGVFSCA